MSTREDKLAMLDLLEEKKRRLRERRAAFIPNAGQEPVIRSSALTKLVLSGNGAGKTALAVNLAMWGALGYNPVTQEKYTVPARVIVVLDKPDKVESVWLIELKKWFNIKPEQLHKKGKPYISQISFDNGSEIIFMFHDQEVMSFESLEGHWFLFDEPPPRHIWVALRRAGRTVNFDARYIIIGTPISGSWLRTELYEPWSKGELEEVECFRFGTAVNEKNLSAGYIERFSKFLTAKEKQMRLFGEFFDLDGLALAHLWKREHHIINSVDWKPHWPVVIGLDPHPSKPLYAVMLGVTPEGYYIVLKEMAKKCLAREFATALAEFAAGYKVMDVVCDSLGSSELTGGMGALSFIQVLNQTWRANGTQLRVRPTTYAEKDDGAWISHIQECLAVPDKPNNMGETVPQLRVLDNCTGVIYDIENVSWLRIKHSEEMKPKLDMAKKDFLSALKYALATQPRFVTKKERIIHSKPSPWSGSKSSKWKPYTKPDEDDDW